MTEVIQILGDGGDPTDARRIYLCQPVLSSVYYSSQLISNVQLRALKIEIYCMFLFILVYLLYEYVLIIRTSDVYGRTSRTFRFGCPWTSMIFSDFVNPWFEDFTFKSSHLINQTSLMMGRSTYQHVPNNTPPSFECEYNK